MSDQLILGIGTLIFITTVWATLAFGYWVFGDLYDKDRATEIKRRRGANDAAVAAGEDRPERPAMEISHDRPEDLLAQH